MLVLAFFEKNGNLDTISEAKLIKECKCKLYSIINYSSQNCL